MKKEEKENLNENRDFSDQKISIFAEKNAKFFFAPLARSKHDSASIENRGSRNADFSEI